MQQYGFCSAASTILIESIFQFSVIYTKTAPSIYRKLSFETYFHDYLLEAPVEKKAYLGFP